MNQNSKLLYINIMKRIKLNYPAFQDLDIFFSHSNKPWSRISRFAMTLKWNPRDDTTPTHGGFITAMQKQFFATEMKLRGIEFNSLESYTGRREQIVSVWRCKRFEDPERLRKAREHLAYLHREQMNYDVRGAILSSPLGAKMLGWMPWFKNQPDGKFCTENVADVIRKFADGKCPLAPSPVELQKYFIEHDGTYRPIKGFKL